MKNNDHLSAVFRPLIGQKPWNVRLGYGSFITMEFGKKARNSVHGEWHLWVYMCDWTLVKNHKALGSAADAREHIEKVLQSLSGRALESVKVINDDFDTDFIFSGGVVLHTRGLKDEAEDVERWLLFMPKTKVLVNLPGMLLLQNSNQPTRVPQIALAH
jgi:hypothetical protein